LDSQGGNWSRDVGEIDLDVALRLTESEPEKIRRNLLTNHNYIITIDPAQGCDSNATLGAYCRNNYAFANISRLNSSSTPDETGSIECISGDTITVQINFNQSNLDLDTSANTYISAIYLNSMYAFLFNNPDEEESPAPESVGISTNLMAVFSSNDETFGGSYGSTLQLYNLPNSAGATTIVKGMSLAINGATDVCVLTVTATSQLYYQLHVTGNLLIEGKEKQGSKYTTHSFWCGFACDPKLSISPD